MRTSPRTCRLRARVAAALAGALLLAACGARRTSAPAAPAPGATATTPTVTIAPLDPEAAAADAAVEAAVSADPELRAALEVFRAGHGQPWTPAQAPAVAAARIVFARLPVVGLSLQGVGHWLGAADEVTPLHAAVAGMDTVRVRYQRHTGELGAFYDVEVIGGRAVKVVAVPTQ